MRTKPPPQLPLFRSNLQARVLAAIVLGNGDTMLGTRDLAARTGAAPTSLQRELQRLEDAGIIRSETIGRAKRYGAARDSPLHRPLRELLRRTVGVEAELKRRLSELPGVRAAAIFGSWAHGKVGPASDIDLLVVGDLEREELVDVLRDVERLAGREISVSAYRFEEFERRLRDGSGFLTTVLSRPVIELVGELPRREASA